MTTIREATEAILQHIVAGWVVDLVPGPGTQPRTVLILDDDKPDPPNDRWAQTAIQISGAEQETLGGKGNRKFSRFGRVILMLRKPPIVGGRGYMDDLIQPALDLFEGCRLSAVPLWFTDVVPQEIGVPKEGRWYEANVTASFEFTQIK